jgi:hypothetical protein
MLDAARRPAPVGVRYLAAPLVVALSRFALGAVPAYLAVGAKSHRIDWVHAAAGHSS